MWLDLAVADECDSKHEQLRANNPQLEEATSPIHCSNLLANAKPRPRLLAVAVIEPLISPIQVNNSISDMATTISSHSSRASMISSNHSVEV
jgi:hypothetical protein